MCGLVVYATVCRKGLEVRRMAQNIGRRFRRELGAATTSGHLRRLGCLLLCSVLIAVGVSMAPAGAHTGDTGTGANLGDSPLADGHTSLCNVNAGGTTGGWRISIGCQYDPVWRWDGYGHPGALNTIRIWCTNGSTFIWSFGMWSADSTGRFQAAVTSGIPCTPDFTVKPKGYCTNGAQCVNGLYHNQMLVDKWLNTAASAVLPSDYFNGGTAGPTPITRPVEEMWGFRIDQYAVGDPVDTASGNLVHGEADLDAPSNAFGLDWGRTYNSRSTAASVLGTGWSTSFSDAIALDASGNARLTKADGRVVVYRAAGGAFVRP
ncbi:MAG TPA: DUF6531 domain-containing protein, partial [Acidimicrobiales bacterium]